MKLSGSRSSTGMLSLATSRASLSPHMVISKGERLPGNRNGQCIVTDAKSLFDCLLREHPSGKQDRKSALELAIILRDLQSSRSMIRWVPHQKMVVDGLTKDDPFKGNGALEHFLKHGVLSFVDMEAELERRKGSSAARSRTAKASRTRLQCEDDLQALCFFLLNHLQPTEIGGSCESTPMPA